MDEQALEDLLALIAERNITLAARRRNSSQPAYSRRLQAIEADHNVALVDRSVRPARPTAALDANREQIESTLAGLRRLRKNIISGPSNISEITIATVQALASQVVPSALHKIKSNIGKHKIRLRSANNSQSFQMLMSEDVSVMLTYETVNHPALGRIDLVDKMVIATDELVPVCAPDLAESFLGVRPGERRIPLIGYPHENFLGSVLFEEIIPRTPHLFSHDVSAGLTNAVMSFSRKGFGLAWLPYSMVRRTVDRGELALLADPSFPSAELSISMLRLRTETGKELQPLWVALAEAIKSVVDDCK